MSDVQKMEELKRGGYEFRTVEVEIQDVRPGDLLWRESGFLLVDRVVIGTVPPGRLRYQVLADDALDVVIASGFPSSKVSKLDVVRGIPF